jgi:hypothetical protein
MAAEAQKRLRKKRSRSTKRGGITAAGAHKRLRKKRSKSTREGGRIAEGAQEKDEQEHQEQHHLYVGAKSTACMHGMSIETRRAANISKQ